MLFADLSLSRRLERAEGFACLQFAEGRKRLTPGCGSASIEHAGTVAVFNGVDSPVTQCFGLGLFEPLTADSLAVIERFFHDRGSAAVHEVSPFAGAGALGLLCSRGYQPVETSNVLFRSLAALQEQPAGGVRVSLAGVEQSHTWAETSAKAWSHEFPEYLDFLRENGAVVAAAPGSLAFLAEFEGKPGAAATLWIHEGVALLGGSATIPELRRRGLHAALVRERLRYAFEHGCDVAMMTTQPGSDSQRNAERHGFRIAYTRIKWRLEA